MACSEAPDNTAATSTRRGWNISRVFSQDEKHLGAINVVVGESGLGIYLPGPVEHPHDQHMTGAEIRMFAISLSL